VRKLLYKLNTKRLIDKCVDLGNENSLSLVTKINEIVLQNGNCVIAVAGSPGSGKSTIARWIKDRGFLTFSREKLFVVDDLRGPDGERYRRRDVRSLGNSLRDKIIMIFDYRAAIYLRKADLCFVLQLNEDERRRNLRRRTSRAFNKYSGKFFRFPPVPLTFTRQNIYNCSKTFIKMLGMTDESMH
jgi:hypothetical protein